MEDEDDEDDEDDEGDDETNEGDADGSTRAQDGKTGGRTGGARPQGAKRRRRRQWLRDGEKNFKEVQAVDAAINDRLGIDGQKLTDGQACIIAPDDPRAAFCCASVPTLDATRCAQLLVDVMPCAGLNKENLQTIVEVFEMAEHHNCAAGLSHPKNPNTHPNEVLMLDAREHSDVHNCALIGAYERCLHLVPPI